MFTHVQPGYDRNAASRRGCEKVIASGRAGQILEHRVDCFEPWLKHDGRVWQTPKWQTFDGGVNVPNEVSLAEAYAGLGSEATERFILCGGSLRMPDYMYRTGMTGSGMCHLFTFGILTFRFLPPRRTVEFHFPADAIYCLQFPQGDTDKMISFNPRHQRAALLNYLRRLEIRGINYNYYNGSEEARQFKPGGLSSVFFWESAEAMLSAFARRDAGGNY